MMRYWRRHRSRTVPRAEVRVTRSDGRALPVRYERHDSRSGRAWTAVVQVPLSREDVAVSVDVRSPRTAVRLETGW